MAPVPANLLMARGLTKRYGEFTAVDALDLTVQRGEVFGLLGPNGAGKTTTIKMLIGLLRPTAGSVTIAGHDVQHDAMAVKRLIGYVPDQPFLYDKLTGREFITLIGRLYGVNDPQRVTDLLAYFDLQSAADDQTGSYSHGMRQKTALCATLIHNPQIIFLDEPTVGLDPRSARLLKNTLRDLATQGRAIVLSTHILEIAQAICDRVAIIDHGHLVGAGTLNDLRAATHAGAGESLEDVFLRLTGGDEDLAMARALVGEG